MSDIDNTALENTMFIQSDIMALLMKSGCGIMLSQRLAADIVDMVLTSEMVKPEYVVMYAAIKAENAAESETTE
jgi:hypothetical protein